MDDRVFPLFIKYQPKMMVFRKWTIPITYAILTVQAVAMLWLYVFPATQKVSSGHSEGCIAPSTASTQDRTTYLQVCNAMQDVLNVPNGQFFYGGTMGAAALRSKNFLQEIHVAHPNFQLRYLDPLSIPPDSGTGIKMLLNGELSFAESQRSLRSQEYQQAKDRGFTLRQIPVAMTGSVFYVHPDLRVRGLSVEQLQAIYTGKIMNWSAVGGPNRAIIPVSQDIDATGSTLSLLLRNLPSNRQKLASSIQLVRDTTTAVRKVAVTPGAIGFGTQALVAHQRSIRLIGLAKEGNKRYIQPVNESGQINKTALQDGKYPLIQRIFVVVRQDYTLDEMAGTAYANLLLSEKGQALIDQAGYLPMRLKENNFR